MSDRTGRRRRPAPQAWLRTAIIFAAAVLAATIAACGGSGAASAPSPAPAPTVQPGGVLKLGVAPGKGQLDPALTSGAPGDVLLISQVLETLVTLDQSFEVQPGLATKWTSEDGSSWAFVLRTGVQFSNGKRFSAADVAYTFERLRSRELGSPMATVLANVRNVVVDDASRVTFVLRSADAEFPAALTSYRAAILCRTVKEPMTKLVGTGPFKLKSLAPGRRAVLVRNTRYWGRDGSGTPLPYLDELRLAFSKDGDAQVAALVAGALDWVGGLTPAQRQAVKQDEGRARVAGAATNDLYELQIRCDQGPGEDVAVRRALIAGTDREALVARVAPGVGLAGNGTIVGPAFRAVYLDEAPGYDPQRARQLLSAAGYADGLDITLAVQTTEPMPTVAKAWRAQMKQIGVNVTIRSVSPVQFYAGTGPHSWQRAEFALVDWGTLATPVEYFRQSLISGAAWNYSRWQSTAFDQLTDAITAQLDGGERARLYGQAQQLLYDEAPVIALLFTKAFAGQARDVAGIPLAPFWATTSFRTAHPVE